MTYSIFSQSQPLKLSKYHGCHNDFLVVVNQTVSQELAQKLCHRLTGCGADGVLLLTTANHHEDNYPRMKIFNADGSQPEMCGNGFRCAIKHLVDRQLAHSMQPIALMTDAGLLFAEYQQDPLTHLVSSVTVDMGPVRHGIAERTIEIDKFSICGFELSMGNPHFVVLSESPLSDAQAYGEKLAYCSAFPHGANISFVRFSSTALACDIVVYERGVGITQACGTGACAVVAVGHFLQKLDKTSEIVAHLPGGDLLISKQSQQHMKMTGPVVWVYDAMTWSMV